MNHMYGRATLVSVLLVVVGPGCHEVAQVEAPPLPDDTFPAAGGSGSCDGDGDGVDAVACGGLDCDDVRREVHPGAEEACGNAADDDCDGLVDEGCGCGVGDLESCWEHEAGKRGVGSCVDGVRRCGADGVWGACTFAVAPSAEASGCDGVDSDCDGVADPDPACGACPADAEEICGNGLDDDCDGTIDPADICTVSCDEVNPRGEDPGDLGCCLRQPPATHEFECHESEGLATCTARECLDLDGDLETRCSKLCDGAGCFCGRRQAGGDLVPVADCGFLTPCARMDCADRQNQPCYSGPPATLGVGICHAGTHSCATTEEGRGWTACEGEQAPVPEICGNDLDDDCDGRIDEEEGSTGRRCAIGARCADGAVEICGNGTDDDCDGFADEGCPTTLGKQACWTGPVESRGIGACGDGTQTSTGGFFGPCEGQKLPAAESCGDGVDSDCDGLGGKGAQEEPSCCAPEPEVCNGSDDDCDGLADEELLNRCGQCPGTGSCYGVTFADAGDCSAPGRRCDGVEPSILDPTLVTLVPNWASGGGLPSLYVARTNYNPFTYELMQVDPATGAVRWSIGTEWIRDIAASPDGSVWISHLSSIRHLSASGAVLCTLAGLQYTAGSLADPLGDLWLIWGNFNSYMLRRVSGTKVLTEESPGVPWPDGVPRCVVEDLDTSGPDTDLLVVDSAAPVLDQAGRLWMLSQNPRYLADGILTTLPTTDDFYYTEPVLAPSGQILVGWPLRALDPEALIAGERGKEIGSYGYDVRVSQGLDDGRLVAMVSNLVTNVPDIVLVDVDSEDELGRWSVPPHDAQIVVESVVVDDAGRVWTAIGTKLFRLNLETGAWDTFTPGGNALVLYSRAMSRTVVKPASGTWSQVVDPGTWNVRWHTLTWEAETGRRDGVSVQVRFSDSVDTLNDSTILCGPYASPPADLSECSHGLRYARVEFKLSGTGQPVVGNVGLTWDRP